MPASKLTNEEQLKRIIYLNNTECRYIVGDPEKYSAFLVNESPNIFDEYVQNNLEDLFKIIKTASEDVNFPRRSQLFNILAKIMHHENLAVQSIRDIGPLALEMCKSDEEFFLFVKYCSLHRKNMTIKLSSAVCNVVRKFYNKKNALELAESYAKANRYHNWSHKDLIKLAHVKSDSPIKNKIIIYILFKNKIFKVDDDEQKIIDVITKSRLLRSTADSDVAVPIIHELKMNIKQVCPDLHQSERVWDAVLQNISVQEILPCLLKLNKLHFLGPSTSIHWSVQKALAFDNVKSSGVHPIEVFIHMKTFENGGKPIDPKLLEYLQREKRMPEKVVEKIKTRTRTERSPILCYLDCCMIVACDNVEATNKRYMVTISVTEHARNAFCLGNKVISSLEAAIAFVTVLLRVEKKENVVVATYKDSGIQILDMNPDESFQEHFTKIRNQKSDYVLWQSPLEWSIRENKKVDVFINFVELLDLCGVPKEVINKKAEGIEPIVQYRQKMNLPNAKLVTFCTSSPRLHLSDGTKNVFDALGFDLGVCQAVHAFCKGSFC